MPEFVLLERSDWKSQYCALSLFVSQPHLPENMAGIQVSHLLSSLAVPISDFLLQMYK